MNEVVTSEPRALLEALAADGVIVSVEKGRIRLKGPQALLGDAFAQLNAQREAVIRLLSDSDEPLGDAPALLEGGAFPGELPVQHLGEALLKAAGGERGVVLFEAGSVQRLSYRALLQEALALLAQWQGQGVKPGDPVLLCLGQMHSGLVCLWAAILGDLIPVPVAMGGGAGEAEGASDLWKSLDEIKRSVWWVADYVSMKTAQYPIGRALASEVAEIPALPLAWRPASQDSRRVAWLVPIDHPRRWVALSHRETLTRSAAFAQALGCEDGDNFLNAVALHRPGSALYGHLTGVCRGLEQFQVDEALVAADPLHWVRLLDDLAIAATWVPPALWQGIPAAIAGATDTQRGELSLSLLRACMFDVGTGEMSPKALAEQLARVELPASAFLPAWGLTQTSMGLLINDNGIDAERLTPGRPLPGASVRVVSGEGETVVCGRRGWLQMRATASARGDWVDVWRELGWQDTGHVALINASGVQLLAWQGVGVTHGSREFPPPEVEPGVAVPDTADQQVVTLDDSTMPAVALSPDITSAEAVADVPVATGTVVTPAPVQPQQLDVFDAPPAAVEASEPAVPDPVIPEVAVPEPAVPEPALTGGSDLLTGPQAQLAPRQSLYGRLQVLARQRPRDIAIHQDTQFVRYQALVQQIELWAASLRGAGIQPTDRIALAMPRGAESIAALFALWRIGAVAIPLDPEEEDNVIREVLASAGPRLTLCHDTLMHGEAGERWKTLVADICPRVGLKELPPAPHLRDDVPPRTDTLAAIFFTRCEQRGVKGACFTHADFLNQFQSLAGVLNLRANARWLATSSPGGGLALFECLMPLLAGATLVIPAGAILTPERLVSPLRDQQITHMIAGTDLLLGLHAFEALPPSLTVLLTDAMSSETCAMIKAAGVELYAMLLMPEIAVCASIQELSSTYADYGHLGEPLLNMGFAVLDQTGHPLAGPGTGEWLVRGPGVASGYWHHDDIQAERYITLQGERYLRTGITVMVEPHVSGRVLMLRRVEKVVTP